MTRRRLFATGALGLLIAALIYSAAPAAAAPTPNITQPAENGTWDGVGSTDFHVTGVAEPDQSGYITKVTVVADSSDGANHHYPRSGDKAEQTYSDTTQGKSQPFDIRIFPDINGSYTLTATAQGQTCNILTGCSAANPGSATRHVVVAVPPKAPAGVGASLKDTVVTVQWNANNEADMLGYLVERNKGSGAYSCIGNVDQGTGSTYKLTDDLKDQDAGDYHYRVTAVRAKDVNSAKPTCKNDGGGLKSPATVAPGAISWKTSTTTTTGPGGGGGGGTTTTVKPTDGLTRFGGSSGAGGSTTKAGSSKKPNLAPLAGLNSINDLAKAPHLPGATGEPDTGFNQLLPFGASGTQTEVGGDLPSTKLPTDSGGNGHTTTLLFLAAGLLVTVLSMHVLWLKAQVDRVPLEALPPGDLPVA